MSKNLEYVLNGDLWSLAFGGRFHVHENITDGERPVAAIGQQTQVGKRLLRRARLAFELGQLITCRVKVHFVTNLFPSFSLVALIFFRQGY